MKNNKKIKDEYEKTTKRSQIKMKITKISKLAGKA